MKDTLLEQALLFLRQLDQDWAELIHTVGPCTFQPKLTIAPFEALVRAVAYQQLHVKAGDAIINKFLLHFNGEFPPAGNLVNAEFDTLRACGFSGRKIETIYGIAEGAINGLVPTRHDAEMLTNDALIDRLTTLKGIGRWTVEMMLIFTLGRQDILPVDDLGIREGYKRFKHLTEAPSAKEMNIIGAAWQPYRTIASWYLWRVPK
jgi:DNA-3-methyladenine glycosylase II